jgi:hypothetical protein
MLWDPGVLVNLRVNLEATRRTSRARTPERSPAELSAAMFPFLARVEPEHFQDPRTIAAAIAVCAIVRSASIVKKEMS